MIKITYPLGEKYKVEVPIFMFRTKAAFSRAERWDFETNLIAFRVVMQDGLA
jgi:hypothetical protein